jgi:hypothetical protein
MISIKTLQPTAAAILPPRDIRLTAQPPLLSFSVRRPGSDAPRPPLQSADGDRRLPPLPPETRGKIKQNAAAWLRWAKENGQQW